MRFVYAILFVLIHLLPLRAQHDLHSSLFSTPVLSAVDSSKVTIRADMVGFFKNNEYFSPIAVGQTLPGTASIFAFGYQCADRFKAELGASFVKYSGRDPLQNAAPFVRLQYSISPTLHIVLGNLYGGINHKLIEPLYQWEKHFTAKPESGLQMILHASPALFADIWVDWQHFILRGDPVPEVLTFGASAAWQLAGAAENAFNLTLPLQLLIYHRGGQIDTSNEPMVKLGNAATGLSAQLRTGGILIKSVSLDFYVVGYIDQRNRAALRPFKEGWGVYPRLTAEATPFAFMAGYWYADRFYAFHGESLFGSFNPYDPEQQLRIRNLLICKLFYDEQLLKGISIGAQIETYSDLSRGKTDFSFGVHLRFNHLFYP